VNTKMKVAVGLSGGVDSSVVIELLKRQGHEVFGLTMKIYDGAIAIQEGMKHACYGPGEKEDVEQCERLCKSLSVPYHVIDLCAEYKEKVLDYFKDEYLQGRTPNPCVICNYALKFGFLLERAKEFGLTFDAFATGHYARTVVRNGRLYLAKAKDLTKDQSYFIFRLDRNRLEKILFPLGEMTKSEVRDLAREFNLEVAEKPESQDFIAGGDYSPVFGDMKIEEGNIVSEDGTVLGTHKGIIHYTIGQRKGLGIAAPYPLYVKEINAKNNTVVVSENKGLFSDGLIADNVFLIDSELKDKPFTVQVRIRQKHNPEKATVTIQEDGSAKVIFEIAQRGVAPGQSCVFYDDDIVLGGGTIAKALQLTDEELQ